LNVSEIFLSIQGEGHLAGVVSVFVRLAGCSLRCRWCDTPYALKADQGKNLTIDEIINEVLQYDCSHVVVTGGEPLISVDLPLLLQKLKQNNKHITLETSAVQYRSIVCDLVSISPKLTNSIPTEGPYAAFAETHRENRLNIAAIRSFIESHDYQLKFVVCNKSDLDEIEEILAQLPPIPKEKIMLMSQARTKQQHRQLGPAVAEMCIRKGFRYCPRLQIELWGSRRGR